MEKLQFLVSFSDKNENLYEARLISSGCLDVTSLRKTLLFQNKYINQSPQKHYNLRPLVAPTIFRRTQLVYWILFPQINPPNNPRAWPYMRQFLVGVF